MFDYQGPVAAVNTLAEFREDYGTLTPEAQNTKLRELLREISPVPKLIGGMEILFTVAIEHPLSNTAAAGALFDALGEVSRAVAEGQYGGVETRDRAWEIMAWAADQLEPDSINPTTPPAVLPEYTTVPVASPAPVLNPVP